MTAAASATAQPWTDSIRKLDMVDAARGWALGDGTVYTTLDGGRSWAVSPLPGAPTSGPLAEDGAFLDVSRAWIAVAVQGDASIGVYRTADGGQTWQETVVTAPMAAGALGLTFADRSDGWLLVSSGPAAGTMSKAVYRTTDGGATWKLVACGCGHAPPSQAWLLGGMYSTGIGARDAEHAWVTGTYHGGDAIPVYATADGGASWSRVRLALPAPYGDATYGNAYPPAFTGADRRQGVLPVVLNLPDRRALVLFTSADGGASWRAAGVLPAEPACSDRGCALDVLDPGHAWLLDPQGRLFATATPQGALPADVPAPYRLVSVDFVTPTQGWGLARDAERGDQVIMTTDDGGLHWHKVEARATTAYRAVPFGGLPV